MVTSETVAHWNAQTASNHVMLNLDVNVGLNYNINSFHNIIILMAYV